MIREISPTAQIALRKNAFEDKERVVLRFAGIEASTFRYDTGIEAIRISHARGHVVVLPFMGQIVWDDVFDRVSLTMDSMFAAHSITRRGTQNAYATESEFKSWTNHG